MPRRRGIEILGCVECPFRNEYDDDCRLAHAMEAHVYTPRRWPPPKECPLRTGPFSVRLSARAGNPANLLKMPD